MTHPTRDKPDSIGHLLRQRLLGAWCVALTLALAGAAAGYRLTHLDKAFDPAAWRAERGNPARDNPRAGMVPLLTRADLLKPGTRRAEVVALLGEPEQAFNNMDRYALGMASYGIDQEAFQIVYQNGRLSSFGLIRY